MADIYSAAALSPVRKVIAARMVEAKRNIPHFRVVIDVEVDALLRLRRELRGQYAGQSLSVNDLLLRSCATALMDEPCVNIQLVNNEIHLIKTECIEVCT